MTAARLGRITRYKGKLIKRLTDDGTVEKLCPQCDQWKPHNAEHFLFSEARGAFQSQCRECSTTNITRNLQASSTARTSALEARRKEQGWLRLHDWLEPEPAAKLQRLCERQGKSRAEIIAALLSAAPES